MSAGDNVRGIVRISDRPRVVPEGPDAPWRATLKIDLDGKVTPCRWTKWCERAVQRLRLLGIPPEEVEIDVRRSPSGGAHVRLIVPSHRVFWAHEYHYAVFEVAIQAILGSDGTREALNFDRAFRGEHANVLHTRRDGAEWGEPWPAARLSWKHAIAAAEGPRGRGS